MTSINLTASKGLKRPGSRENVRRFDKDDSEALLDCLTDGNDNWPPFEIGCSGLDHLQWKFLGNNMGPSFSCLAEVDGRVLSFHGSIMTKVNIGGRKHPAYQNVDMYTRPDARGSGWMGEVFDFHQKEADRNGIQFGYGFPNASSHQIMGRRGYRDLPIKIVEFQYIVDSKSFFSGRLAMLKTTGYQVYQRLKTIPAVDDDIVEDRSPRFDKQADMLFEQAAKDFRFIVVRDQEYLNWRYADPRSGNFIISQFRKGDDLVGYIVLKVIGSQCYIADLLVDPKHPSALDAMLRSAKGIAREGGASVMFCRLPSGHPYAEAMNASGFTVQGDPGALGDPRIIYRTDDEDLSRVVEDGETVCHITFGDTDWV